MPLIPNVLFLAKCSEKSKANELTKVQWENRRYNQVKYLNYIPVLDPDFTLLLTLIKSDYNLEKLFIHKLINKTVHTLSVQPFSLSRFWVKNLYK